MFFVEYEAICQAVRLGHPQVITAHLLLALSKVDQELTAAGDRLAEALAGHDHAGDVLCAHGITYPDAAWQGERLPDPDIPSVLRQPHRWWRWRPPDPPFGRDAAAAVYTAQDSAASLGHQHVSTGHLLVGILENGSGSACELIRQRGVDPQALLNETRRRLAH